MARQPWVLAALVCLPLVLAAAPPANPTLPEKKSEQKPVEDAPAKALVSRKVARQVTRRGRVFFSDGTHVTGDLYLKGKKKLRVWDKLAKKYRNVQLDEVSMISVVAARERVEKEWRFKEEGSDVKVFTGRTFPRIDFELLLTFPDKRKLECRIPQGTPVYLQTEKRKPRRFLIQPYLKGDRAGQMPADLLYVKKIDFEMKPEKVGKVEETEKVEKAKKIEKVEKVEKPAAPVEPKTKAKPVTETLETGEGLVSE